MEENGDFVYSNFEKEVLPEVPCNPSLKRVSFGSEQFDLNRTAARKKTSLIAAVDIGNHCF
jgi:hypothetical protein